jgi:hypothetical protein
MNVIRAMCVSGATEKMCDFAIGAAVEKVDD